MAGRSSVHAAECLAGGFIGADFDIHEDLSGKLPDEWRLFNQRYIPVLQEADPERSKISSGLACGFLWTVCRGIRPGDVVLTPDGSGSYLVGEVTGEYSYVSGGVLPHRRTVRWFSQRIARSELSDALRRSAGSIGTVSNLSEYRVELESLLGSAAPPQLVASNPDVEDPLAFAMEKHLEDFLVANWGQTMLASEWSIVEEDGEKIGQQYQTDAGPIDILARSNDGGRILVVELKRGRANDVVVGQILRYMGYIKEQVAEPGQTVEGAIIALEDDQKLRWAISAVPGLNFYRYQVSFRLLPG